LGRFAKILLAGILAGAVTSGVALSERGRVSGSSKTAAVRPTYYQDVKPILEGRCAGCHYSGGIAPFSLKTYRNAYAHRREIAYMVSHRLMPPWKADSRVRRYRYDMSLTRAQIRTLVRWAARGAARGNPDQQGRSLRSTAAPSGLSRIDAVTRTPLYQPRSGVDDYRCFVLPWRAKQTGYLAGMQIDTGRRSSVHHLGVFLIGADDARQAEAHNGEDARAGFGCGLSDPSVGAMALAPVGGWLPGSGTGGDLIDGTGVRVHEGDRLLLNVHYFAGHHSAPHASAITLKLRLAARVRAAAAPATFQGLTADFAIPPHVRDYRVRLTADPLRVPGFVPGLDIARGFIVHAVGLHMHLLGKSGSLTLVRADGRREVLLSIRSWDARWQAGYALARPLRVYPGDSLAIECRYTNTTDRVVVWGMRVADEMCTGFLFVSEPKAS